MVAFWHFLPNTKEKELASSGRLLAHELRHRGCDGALRDCHTIPKRVIAQNINAGPEGMSGVMLFPVPLNGTLPRHLGYDPENQTWRKIGDGSKRWIGWLTDQPPTPTDLERHDTIDGLPVVDAYDHAWIVPIARSLDNPRGRLPAAFGWDKEDKPVVGVSEIYREFWDDSGKLWDLIDTSAESQGAVLAQDFTPEQDQFAFEMVCRALAINYRVDHAILSTLDKIRPGWMSTDVASIMLNAIVDFFKYREWIALQKKIESQLEAPAGSTSSGGTPDEITTAPVEESKP